MSRHITKSPRVLPRFEGTFRELDAFANDVALAGDLDRGLDQISPSLEAATFTTWRRARAEHGRVFLTFIGS